MKRYKMRGAGIVLGGREREREREEEYRDAKPKDQRICPRNGPGLSS